MCGRKWTDEEITFLRANYPEHTAYWCAQQLGRSRSSVAVKISNLWLRVRAQRPAKVERYDPELGPAEPPLANRCVDCDNPSPTRRCPDCQKKHLAQYRGECWGPTYDEAYGVAQ